MFTGQISRTRRCLAHTTTTTLCQVDAKDATELACLQGEGTSMAKQAVGVGENGADGMAGKKKGEKEYGKIGKKEMKI